MKSAIVTQLHKKHSLPIEDLSSYCPIFNLNFISKILERIFHNRLNYHLTSFPSLSPFRSAYRKFHSAETALLRIYNDLLVSISQHKLSALVLWYLFFCFFKFSALVLWYLFFTYFLLLRWATSPIGLF